MRGEWAISNTVVRGTHISCVPEVNQVSEDGAPLAEFLKDCLLCFEIIRVIYEVGGELNPCYLDWDCRLCA